MIAELQPGDVGIAEILPLSTRDKGARLAIPGLVDLSELVVENNGIPRLVFESVQELLLKVALQTARDDEIRRERPRQGVKLAKVHRQKVDLVTHERIITLRQSGLTIERTATQAGYRISQSNASGQSISRKRICDPEHSLRTVLYIS